MVGVGGASAGTAPLEARTMPTSMGVTWAAPRSSAPGVRRATYPRPKCWRLRVAVAVPAEIPSSTIRVVALEERAGLALHPSQRLLPRLTGSMPTVGTTRGMVARELPMVPRVLGVALRAPAIPALPEARCTGGTGGTATPGQPVVLPTAAVEVAVEATSAVVAEVAVAMAVTPVAGAEAA